jgi:hypothetical protein
VLQADAASRRVPVIANVRPRGSTYLMEDFYYAGGLLALMTRLNAHLDLDQRTVSEQTWREILDGVTVYNDDVIRTPKAAIYQEGALAVPTGNLAPNGCVMKPSACERSRRHAGPCPDPAQCRTAGRAEHAGMGHATDPREAVEARRARHGADFRRADERHQLRRCILHVSQRPMSAGRCRWRAAAT